MNNHREEIRKKSKMKIKEFNKLLKNILKKVTIIPTADLLPYRDQAIKIIDDIDPDDDFFIACSLAHNCPLWSDDKHLKKQDRVKIISTKELIEILDPNL